MEKTKIKINKAEIELLEYIPDFYSIAEITNPLLSEMRPGIKTWVSEDVFDSYFSIAGTQKGAMHIRALVNGWNELVDEYNRYSYVTIYKNDNVESLSYFLGEDGEFLRQGV